MSLENKFWGSFKRHLQGHWCRVESGDSQPGIPDVNGCIMGIEIWIELKREETFKIRPTQYAWIKRRLRNQGNVLILVRMSDGSLRLYDGKDIGALREKKLSVTPMFEVTKRYWADMADYIFSIYIN